MSELSTEQLREIAHRAGHYADSHGNLPVIKFPTYSCDEDGRTIGVSYRDIACLCNELVALRTSDKCEHLMPMGARTIGDELISWKCTRCGEWIRE